MWIRTKSISCQEFFHGMQEIIVEDTPVTLFMGEDEQRPLAERVAKFLPRVNANYTIIDTKEHELKGISRPNFCGWSALGPISLLIEDVIGFYDIDAAQNTIKWNLSRKDIHGIKNLKFGTTLTDIIYTGNNNITVKSTAPYLLFVNGKKLKVKTGDNNFKL